MKKILLTLSLFAASMTQAQFQWAKQIGGSSGDGGKAIATDASGNVYTAGYFNGVADFDPGAGTYTLNTTSNTAYVSKLDAAGNFVWAKKLGDASIGNSIALDVSGNIYITGEFYNTSDFDPGAGTFTLSSAGDKDIFITKLDGVGNFVWAKKFGGPAEDNVCSIKTDASGNIYASGSFKGTCDFTTDTTSFIFIGNSSGDKDIYVFKLDNTGNLVWAKTAGAGSMDIAYSLSLDAAANIYVAGEFAETVDFDPGPGTFTLSSPGVTSDIFVLKLDVSGNFTWAKSMGGVSNDVSTSIVSDASGNIYSTGYFSATADFDPGAGVYPLNPSGSYDNTFISKLDASGNFIWAKNIGGDGIIHSEGITLDESGNINAIGWFQDKCDFDPDATIDTSTSSGSNDVFILKLDMNGNYIGSIIFGGPQDDIGTGMAVTATGEAYATGYFSGTADLATAGTFTMTSFGLSDAFVNRTSYGAPVGLLNKSHLNNNSSVYPNPSNGLYYINLNTNAQITIRNILGEEITTTILPEGKRSINIQDQPSGIYLVDILQENYRNTIKLIKE